MIRRPPRSTLSSSSAASDVYKRQSLCVAAQATQGAGRSRGGPGQPGSRNRQVRQLARARTRLRSRRLDSRYILVVQAPPQVPEALYRWAHVSLTMIPGTVTVRPWSRGPTDKLDRESPRASRPPVCRGLDRVGLLYGRDQPTRSRCARTGMAPLAAARAVQDSGCEESGRLLCVRRAVLPGSPAGVPSAAG